MNPSSIHTILAPAESIYKEKGSKFLAFAYPVATDEEVREKLGFLKKKYFDARHHCYAYCLTPPETRFRAFDAGEPNHSAGDPILGRIRSRNLANVLVVVVRYFGGTKLGVGGLMQAYKAAAEGALSNATIVEQELTEKFRIRYDYSFSAEVMRLVKGFDIAIVKQEFGSGGVLDLEVKIKNKDQFLEKVNLMRSRKVDLVVEGPEGITFK